MTADGAPISIRDGEELRLKYDDRDFQIRFGTDRFSVGNELYYEVRLEGKTNQRSPVTTSAVWRSGALNEGHYLLHVQAKDSNGVGKRSMEFTLCFHHRPAVVSHALDGDGFGIVGHSCFLSLHPLADVAAEAAGTGIGADSRPAYPGSAAQ